MVKNEKILIVTVKMLKNPTVSIENLTKDTIEELRKRNFQFEFLELILRQNNKLGMIFDYIRNTFIILSEAKKYEKIYFVFPSIYIYPLGLVFPNKRIYTCIHHIDIDDSQRLNIWWKLVLKNAGTMIAISKFTKNQLLKFSYKNIFVNHNGISQEFFPEKINDFLDFDYILYVGGEGDRKNLKTLFEAFKIVIEKYPNLKLIKIGIAEQVEIEKTNNYVEQLGITSNVIFLRERKSPQELRKYYSNAICYVSVSILEGFGLTIPEALACACPIVSSDIPPFREIVGDSQVMVEAMDTKGIANGIIRYIEDLEFKEKMINDGLSISKNFSYEKNVDKLIQILSK